MMTEPYAMGHILDLVNVLCARFKDDPLDPAEIDAILAETGLSIRSSLHELGYHLANIKMVVPYYAETRQREQQDTEEEKAFRRFQRAVTLISTELESLSNPESPLSRAMEKITLFAELPELLGPQSLTRLIAVMTSEEIEQADRVLQRDIEAARTGVSSLTKYIDLNFPKHGMKEQLSVIDWKRFCVGVLLPALFKHHFGQDLKVSTVQDPFIAGGPGVRFLSATTRILGIVKTDGKPYSAEGLRKLHDEGRNNPQLQKAWITKLLKQRSVQPKADNS